MQHNLLPHHTLKETIGIHSYVNSKFCYMCCHSNKPHHQIHLEQFNGTFGTINKLDCNGANVAQVTGPARKNILKQELCGLDGAGTVDLFACSYSSKIVRECYIPVS